MTPTQIAMYNVSGTVRLPSNAMKEEIATWMSNEFGLRVDEQEYWDDFFVSAMMEMTEEQHEKLYNYLYNYIERNGVDI